MSGPFFSLTGRWITQDPRVRCGGQQFEKMFVFDPVTRLALIEKGRKHPDLKRHIEKWEELKRIGSPRAGGKSEE